MSKECDLYYLVYVSRQRSPMEPDTLREIMETAVAFNQQKGITGMLVFRDGSFLQVLEGPRQAVTSLYERICLDSRHQNIELLIGERASRRFFAEWSMGFCELARPEDKALCAYTTFIEEGFYARLKPEAASIPASLLSMFLYGYNREHTFHH
ncbi:MAG: BLUF domain-containing protein [Marinobacterium sp.]|nr:BLUF domain-containing protein [Marinobacterium sp.]